MTFQSWFPKSTNPSRFCEREEMLIPDSKLVSPADIEDRIQSIYRQRAAEIDKGPRRTRSGESRPGWQDAHTDRLTKLDLRVDTLKARLRSKIGRAHV